MISYKSQDRTHADQMSKLKVMVQKDRNETKYSVSKGLQHESWENFKSHVEYFCLFGNSCFQLSMHGNDQK